MGEQRARATEQLAFQAKLAREGPDLAAKRLAVEVRLVAVGATPRQ